MSADKDLLVDIKIVGGCGVTMYLKCSDAFHKRMQTDDPLYLGDQLITSCFRNNTRGIERNWDVYKYGNQHLEYPIRWWQDDVAKGNTRLGYEQWVSLKMQNEES